jgi:hypothetical protein
VLRGNTKEVCFLLDKTAVDGGVRGAKGTLTTFPPLRSTVSVRWPRSSPRASLSAPNCFGDTKAVQGEQRDESALGR